MKTKILAVLVLTFMSLNASVYSADEIALPVISKPAVLQEGTQRVLTAAQIAELLPWAKNSKASLIDLLDSIQNLTSEDKVERLLLGIKQVVGESAPKQTELLMRYVLNRALVINEILSNEMKVDEVGTVDAKVRTLVSAIGMSISFYEQDMKTLTKKSAPDFVSFGKAYFQFLNELNKSIFDASAQYAIQKTSLEWYQWDLYRDLNNATYAPDIVKIQNALKVLPQKQQTDAQAIRNIQYLKKIAQQLSSQPTTNNEAPKKDAEVVTSVVQQQLQTALSKFPSGTKFTYSSFDKACYPRTAGGELIYSSKAPDILCARPDKYLYSSYDKACYMVSNAGDLMYSSKVDDDFCWIKAKYTYSSYDKSCYKVSNANEIMYTSPVVDDLCAVPGKFLYSSYDKACYKISTGGDFMYNSIVNDKNCM